MDERAVQETRAGDFFSEIAQAAVSVPISSRTEFDKYSKDLNAVPGRKDFCTIGWWRENRVLFPVLAGVARSVFGSRPTSANIERAFSSGRHLMGILRSRLLPQRVEVWMFLHLIVHFSNLPESFISPHLFLP